MIKEKQYISLMEVLSRTLRHPLLLDVNIEAAVLYALDFIHIVGCNDMFEDRECEVRIENYRGQLPCDLVSITQVMDLRDGLCLRAMTGNFIPDDNYRGEHAFKTLNTIIYTTFKEGNVKIAYKAIPIDENGYPLLIDNPTYLKALELYIKKEVFTILFDTGKIQAGVMNKAELDYCWKVGLLLSEMTIPSESEMEAISRSWCTMIPNITSFDRGFNNLGDREYLRRH